MNQTPHIRLATFTDIEAIEGIAGPIVDGELDASIFDPTAPSATFEAL